MANELKYTSIFQEMAFGDFGMRIISSGETSIEGEFFGAIQVVADCSISFSNNTEGGDSSITNLALSAGQIIYGNITSVVVASGKLIAYLR